MSDTIAPLPPGNGIIAAASEHHPRRDDSHRHPPDDEHHPDGHHPSGQHGEQQRRHDSFPPPLEEPGVPAETLFAAAILGNELVQQPPSPEELRLRNDIWQPPDSPLHLKDKQV